MTTLKSRLYTFALCLAVCLLAAFCAALPAHAQDVINTVVGGGPNNIPAVNANINAPLQLAVDTSGNVYVVSYMQQQVLKISTTGVATLVAGNGFSGYSGDGGQAVDAEMVNPQGVAVDGANPANVYIADTGNCVIRKVSQSTGIITTIAGGTANTSNGCAYSGDGGKASAAQMYYPIGLAVNATTNDLYIADTYNGAVRKVAGGVATGTITTIAGSGGTSASGANCGGSAPFGDGGAGKSAYLCYPQGVALDTTASPANVFITETLGGVCDVREVVGSSSKIYQVAGSYSLGCGFTNNVNALDAQFSEPNQLHVAVSGSSTTVQVADYGNGAIRQFTLTYSSSVPKPGSITTIAGGNGPTFCGDGGPALSACFYPEGIAYDSSGNYYIADSYNNRVRKVLKSNTDINTIAGWGQGYYSDPVGISASAGTPSLYYPTGVYADPTSTKVYVGGYQGQAVYAWDSAANTISDFAGSGVGGFAGDGGKANSVNTELYYPAGIGKDSNGNVYIADTAYCVIREVSASTGDITTVVGGTAGTPNGCGYTNGSAASSQIDQNSSGGIAFDSSNNLYIADYYNCAIRKLTASTGQVSTIAGSPAAAPVCGYTGDGGPATSAEIYNPEQISLDGAGNVYFADYSNYRVREIVAATGIIQTVAGNGTAAYQGDGAALDHSLYYPTGVTADPNGNVFISDTSNQILRWVTPSGEMITFAGTVPGSANSSVGFSGDGGPALSAQFFYPQQISRDSSGNTYVADENNYRVRQITPWAGYGLSSTSVSFPTQPAGTQSDFQPVTVSAVGPTTISAISVTAGFSEIDDCTGTALTANQTCEIDVYFQPTIAGKINGTLTIASNAFFALNPNTIELTGTGAGLKLSGSLAFGTQPLKSTTNSTLTLTNSGTAVAISKIYFNSATAITLGSSSTCPLTGGTLAANASCTVVATFAPTAVGSVKSTLVISSNDPASPYLAQATGTGTEVKLSAASIAFGSISYGTTATTNLTLTNTGSAAFTIATALSNSVFTISSTGKTCTTSLAAGASCVLPVEYDPTAVGASSGTLTITTNGGSSPVIPLSGTATSDVSVSPTSIAFATITHGTTEVSDVTVTNVGTIKALNVSTAVSGTGAAEFTVLSTGNTCTAAGVAPGKSCTLPVQFAPAAAASYAATLTITTNGGTNPTIALTGTGK